MSWTDKELGMDRRISRRDFMQGAAMAVTASLVSTPTNLLGQAAAEAQNEKGYDPPALHGMRGSHKGAFEVAHQLRDGTFWAHAGQPESTGESYDLIVVGGGISGLSSARFFHQAAGRAHACSSSRTTTTSAGTLSAMSSRWIRLSCWALGYLRNREPGALQFGGQERRP